MTIQPSSLPCADFWKRTSRRPSHSYEITEATSLSQAKSALHAEPPPAEVLRAAPVAPQELRAAQPLAHALDELQGALCKAQAKGRFIKQQKPSLPEHRAPENPYLNGSGPMPSLRLLIVDDHPTELALVRRLLEKDHSHSYEITEATSLSQAKSALHTEPPPDCVLLSDHLPDGTSVDFLRNAAADGDVSPPFPTVILTDNADLRAAVASLRAGALDYLLKADLCAESLRLAIQNAVERWQMRRELDGLAREARESHASLVAAKEAAVRANAAKDEFLAMLSHELRTPLTPVLFTVSALQREPGLPPEVMQSLGVVERNILLEARLIDDLLDLTQIASGRLAPTRAPVDLHACVCGAIETCRNAFENRGVTVRTSLEASRPVVLGEHSRLSQVLWNLLKNAVKFSRPAGTVEVVTREVGGLITVEVRDRGVGIDPDALETIFGAFGSKAPQPGARNLGLGLAISRAIVEAHGGDIRAFSDGPNQGAIFRITLPLGTASDTVVGEGTSTESSSAGSGGGGRRVLLIEDHEDTRRSLNRALRKRGYEVTGASNAATAVEEFRDRAFDLVICDLGLPDGTGWETLEQLKSIRPVRAIAMSGYGMQQDLDKSRAAGFSAHLTKPVNIQRLEAALDEALLTDAVP